VPVSDSKFDRFFDRDDAKERCGFILKGNRMVEVQNVHPDPTVGFEIAADAIVRHEAELKATWHTHPTGSSTLSDDDYTCFLNWPHLEHYIISSGGVKRYVVQDGAIINAD
jgi:proteasome lid subunit RPN8/RPN11